MREQRHRYPTSEVCPHKRLFDAIVMQAAVDLTSDKAEHVDIKLWAVKKDAAEWVTSRDTGLGSFKICLQVANLEDMERPLKRLANEVLERLNKGEWK